jgi:hypothetical protein
MDGAAGLNRPVWGSSGFLHEFPFCPYRKLACLEQGPDRCWRLKGQGGSVPLLFSLQATKPGNTAPKCG